MSDASHNDAIVRLVQAIKPTLSKEEEASSIEFARRILNSQLGGGAASEGSSQQFALTWKRRMQGKINASAYQNVEHLYHDLSNAAQNPDLSSKIMTVLTKCVGIGRRREGNATKTFPAEQTPAFSNNHNIASAMMTEPITSNTAHITADALAYEEQQLLRELLSAMQGVDGERIKFYSKEEYGDVREEEDGPPPYEGIRVLSPALFPHKFQPEVHHRHRHSRLGSGAMDALRICGEAGWLFRRLQRYVDFHLNSGQQQMQRGGGRVARALARAVANELQSYHNHLAQLEANLPTWTLRQWLVQIQRHSVLQRLTVLAILTEALPTGLDDNEFAVGGGILLSALYKHSLHGDPRHKSLVQSILYPTSQPWFHMLYLWTTQGLLPASWGGDFFVILQPSFLENGRQNHNGNRNGNKRSDENKYLWQEKYALDKKQIPASGIFDPDLIRPAFVVGKGINFIRTCLNQLSWTLKLEEDNGDDINAKQGTANEGGEEGNGQSSKEAEMERLGYHYVANPVGMYLNPKLTQTLHRAESLVHSHILRSLRKDHNLIDHLFALKQFMFHGQGDFFSSLLEGLYVEFGCGNNSRRNLNTSFVSGHNVAGIYHHQLLSIMEVALRQTNAKDLPIFCLERLTVEMLPFEPSQENSISKGLFATPSRKPSVTNDEDNRTVWEIFMLDYQCPDQLMAIVHDKAMEQYKLVYSFLFGLRKVEYMLHRTWRKSATLQHALQMMAQNNGLQRSSSVGYAHATILLRKISMTRQSMTHFCVNLKSYCMLEVLEGGWKDLLESLEEARTLDEAIRAHDRYLESICRKTLLLKGRRARGASRTNNKFRYLFGELLSIASEFCILQDRLFDEALQAAERVAQRRREAERRMTQGQWGFENESDLAEEESFFGLADASALAEVGKLAEGFHQCMASFLEALDAKVNGITINLSNTMTAGDGDDSDDDDMQAASDWNRPSFLAEILGDEQDIDALRSLSMQLDHNHHYGMAFRN